MFKKIFGRLLGETHVATPPRPTHPPAPAAESPAAPRAPSAQQAEAAATYLCREPILGEDQRIVAYLFALQEAAHQHIRHSSRRLRHLYAEILIGHLLDARIDRLLERFDRVLRR